METTIIHKHNGLFDLRQLINFFSSARDGIYRVEITLVRKQRSNDQNAWLWGCIYPLLLNALINEGWELSSVEEVHELCKARFADRSIVNRNTGELMRMPSSTAQMNTAEFMAYCDKIRDWAYEYLNVTIPEPKKELVTL